LCIDADRVGDYVRPGIDEAARDGIRIAEKKTGKGGAAGSLIASQRTVEVELPARVCFRVGDGSFGTVRIAAELRRVPAAGM